MQTREPYDVEDDVELVPLELPLDRDTRAWLNRLSRNDREAAEMVANMVRMIREDDEQAHRVLN